MNRWAFKINKLYENLRADNMSCFIFIAFALDSHRMTSPLTPLPRRGE